MLAALKGVLQLPVDSDTNKNAWILFYPLLPLPFSQSDFEVETRSSLLQEEESGVGLLFTSVLQLAEASLEQLRPTTARPLNVHT